VSFCIAAGARLTAWHSVPFPQDDAILELVRYRNPAVCHTICWSYAAMWFTTPWILSSLTLSAGRNTTAACVCRTKGRKSLEAIVGEVHRMKNPKHPRNLGG
jgi:hypothetical protein